MSGALDTPMEVLAEHALACHDQDQPQSAALQKAMQDLGAESTRELRMLRDAASLACAAMVAEAAPQQLAERLRAAGHRVCAENLRNRRPTGAPTSHPRQIGRAHV